MERLLILRRASSHLCFYLLLLRPHTWALHQRRPGRTRTLCCVMLQSVWMDACRPGSPFPPRFDTFSHNSCRLILLNWFTTEVFFISCRRLRFQFLPLCISLCALLSVSWPLDWIFLSTRGQKGWMDNDFWSSVCWKEAWYYLLRRKMWNFKRVPQTCNEAIIYDEGNFINTAQHSFDIQNAGSLKKYPNIFSLFFHFSKINIILNL